MAMLGIGKICCRRRNLVANETRTRGAREMKMTSQRASNAARVGNGFPTRAEQGEVDLLSPRKSRFRLESFAGR